MSRVQTVETWAVRVPYDAGRAGHHIVLRLRTDDGLSGIGYVTNLSRWHLDAQLSAVRAFAEAVVGTDPQAAPATTAALLVRSGRPQFDGLARSAVGVVDCALWDLKARALDLPLFRLLGSERAAVPTYASWALWWQNSLELTVENALGHVERGFLAMKYRLGGVPETGRAVERSRRIREAVGPDIELMADLNWRWTVDQTIRNGRALAEFELAWLEDPIDPNDVAGLGRINAELQTPICTGEGYHEPAQFRRLLDSRGADIVMLDLEVGGVTEWLKLASLAAGYGVAVSNHGCTEIACHLVAAAPNGRTVEYVPWAEPLFAEVPEVRDGRLHLSERPGLGLELDPAALVKFQLP